jgi:homospermidine synthase
LYRPTINYLFSPSDLGSAAVYEFEMRDYKLQPRTRVMLDSDLVGGANEIGALLLGHDFGAWWSGSCVTAQQAKDLLPGYNPAILQSGTISDTGDRSHKEPI